MLQNKWRLSRCKLHWKHIDNPLHEKINAINEAFHIYKSEDVTYISNIKAVLNEAIIQIIKFPKTLIKLYKASNIKYAKIIKPGNIFSLNIGTITFYIGIDNTFNNGDSDDINISIDEIDLGDFIQNTQSSLYEKNKNVSIILTVGNNLLKPFIKNQFITDISHELIHVFHALKKELNIKAGDAYTYAENIIEIIDLIYQRFPDAYFFLQQNNELTKTNLIKVFCGCIYYLDTSEYSAWLDSFSRELQRRFYFNTFSSYNKEKRNIETYIIFSSINKLLKNIKQYFAIYTKNVSSEILEILQKYFLSLKTNENNINLNKLSISSLINFWIKRTDTFIKKCNLIADKLDEIKKDT